MLIYATEEDLQFRKDLGVATEAHGITLEAVLRSTMENQLNC